MSPPFESLTSGHRLPRTALLQRALCVTHRVECGAQRLDDAVVLAGPAGGRSHARRGKWHVPDPAHDFASESANWPVTTTSVEECATTDSAMVAPTRWKR